MNNQLAKLNFLDKHAENFKESKKRLETNSKQLQSIIENNTKQEMEDVKKAIELLNIKMDKIMKTDVVKEKSNQMKEDQKSMVLSMEVATNTFFKIRKMLYDKKITRQERLQYEDKVYKHIVSKFLNQEEIDKFEKLIKLGPLMMLQ